MNRVKADALFLIMGTNPFPNIISALTRIKESGYVYCICSEETRGKPFERFRKLFNNNGIRIDMIEMPKNSVRSSIENEIRNKLEEIFLKITGNILIELNYTGGKKIVSAIAYDIIKNSDYKSKGRKVDINLTYIDSERELMYIESGGSEKQEYTSTEIKLPELEESFKIGIKEIIETYNNPLDKNKMKEKPDKKQLSNILGNMFENVSLEDYNKRINFIRTIYEISRSKKKTYRNDLDMLFSSSNLPVSFEDIKTAGFENDEIMRKYFWKSVWFEDYILDKLIPLKEDNVIEDLIGNVEKEKVEENDENKFEVDIVAYKKYKLYAISITTISDQEEAASKLYEIHQRANDLAGEETGICYITLCWDVEELKRKYQNIWDNPTPKNVLIMGAKDLVNIKEKVKGWIYGGEINEQ